MAMRKKTATKTAGRGKTSRKPVASRKAAARGQAPAPRTAAARPKARAREKRKQPETLRLRGVTPSMTASDVEKSLAFYRDVLGFTPKDRWESDGKLMGVEMVAGAVVFMLTQDDWKKGKDRVKGEGIRVYCKTVQDIDTLAAEIKRRGGVLSQEPTDQPWGQRDFAITDPDGFKITIGTDRRP